MLLPLAKSTPKSHFDIKKKKKIPITHPTVDLQSKRQPMILALKPSLP